MVKLYVFILVACSSARSIYADDRCQYNRCSATQPTTRPLTSAVARPDFDLGAAEALAQLLERPLILGASVSDDFLAASPGRIAYQWFTDSSDDQANFRKIAFSQGQIGPDILKHLSVKDLNDRSVVIAVDLFFHDDERVLSDCPESVEEVEKFIAGIAEQSVPLIIGTVPRYPFPRFHLLKTWPFIAPILSSDICRDSINTAIADHCSANQNCLVLDLQKILDRVMTPPIGAVIDGQEHPLVQIFPDLTHPSELASSYVAKEMLNAIVDNKTLVAE